MVRTQDFHSCNTSSILVHSTSNHITIIATGFQPLLTASPRIVDVTCDNSYSGSIVQRIEQRSSTPCVAGLNPARVTNTDRITILVII